MHKLIVFLLFGFLLTSCAMPQTQATAPEPAVPTAATATVAIPTSTVVPTETPSPTVDVVAVMRESIASKVGVPAEALTVYPVENPAGQEALVFAVDPKEGRQFLVQGELKWELMYNWNADQARLELNAVDEAGNPLFTVVSVDGNGDMFVSWPDANGVVGEAELSGNLLDETGTGRSVAELMGIPPATAEVQEAMAKGAKLVPKEGGVWEVMYGGVILQTSSASGWIEKAKIGPEPFMMYEGKIVMWNGTVYTQLLDGDDLPLKADEQIKLDDGMILMLLKGNPIVLVDPVTMEVKQFNKGTININGGWYEWKDGAFQPIEIRVDPQTYTTNPDEIPEQYREQLLTAPEFPFGPAEAAYSKRLNRVVYVTNGVHEAADKIVGIIENGQVLRVLGYDSTLIFAPNSATSQLTLRKKDPDLGWIERTDDYLYLVNFLRSFLFSGAAKSGKLGIPEEAYEPDNLYFVKGDGVKLFDIDSGVVSSTRGGSIRLGKSHAFVLGGQVSSSYVKVDDDSDITKIISNYWDLSLNEIFTGWVDVCPDSGSQYYYAYCVIVITNGPHFKGDVYVKQN